MTRHRVLGPRLSHLHEVDEAALALLESTDDGLLRELGKVIVLDDEVVEVVAEVVGTGRAAVAVENAEEANLGPLDVEVLLAFGLEDIEDDGDAVLVVVADDTLVRVRRVRLDQAALLLGGLRRLVILQEKRLRVQHGRVLAEEKRLYLHELDVCILRGRARQARAFTSFRFLCRVLVGVAGGHRVLINLFTSCAGLGGRITVVRSLGLGRLVVVGVLGAQGEALAHAQLFFAGGRRGLRLAAFLGVLELGVEVGVDAEGLHLLGALDLGRTLPLL